MTGQDGSNDRYTNTTTYSGWHDGNIHAISRGLRRSFCSFVSDKQQLRTGGTGPAPQETADVLLQRAMSSTYVWMLICKDNLPAEPGDSTFDFGIGPQEAESRKCPSSSAAPVQHDRPPASPRPDLQGPCLGIAVSSISQGHLECHPYRPSEASCLTVAQS